MGLMGSGGGGSSRHPGSSSFSNCRFSSFASRTWTQYRETANTIDSTIDSVLPWPLKSATGIASAAGGGLAAKSYGGITALQEGARYFNQLNSAPFSLFRVGSLDIVRVGATTLRNGVGISIAWNGGLLVGSGIYEATQGDVCN